MGKPFPSPGACVLADWVGWLPETKRQAFNVYAEECEVNFMMLSISLDEAIGLRDSGDVTRSCLAVSVIPAFCVRLTDLLQGMLHSLEEHTKRFGVRPSVTPLNPDYFQGKRERRCALKSCLVNGPISSQRAQFSTKISTLCKMVANLALDLSNAAGELTSYSAAAHPAPLWATLDTGHFDLNTCLRESMVLLKCFLRALPDDQLQQFQETVTTHREQFTTAPASSRTDNQKKLATGGCSGRSNGGPH
jgi:hypothetical protein